MYEIFLHFILLIFGTSPARINNTSSNLKQEVDSTTMSMNSTIIRLMNQNQFLEAHSFLDSIRKVNRRNEVISTYNKLKGLIFTHTGNQDSAYYYLQEAIKTAYIIDTTNKFISAARIQMCNFWIKSRNWDSSLNYGLQAYYLSKKVDTSQLPIICLFLVTIFNETRDLENYKKYLFEGLEFSKGRKEEKLYLNDLATYYSQINQIDSAVYYFEEYFKKEINPSPYNQSAKHLNLGGIYVKKGYLSKGLLHLKTGLEIRRKTASLTEIVYLNIAIAYDLLNKIELANRYHDTASLICRDNRNYYQLAAMFDQRSSIKNRKKQFREAYNLKDSALFYLSKSDSINLAKSTKEIEAKYSLKDKIDSLRILSVQNKLNIKTKEQQNTTIASLVTGFLLVIGLAASRYKRMKLNTKFREYELHQAALRSKMQPHFIFNSLSILQSLINFEQKEKALTFLHKFSRYARISFENGAQNTVKLQDEIQALQHYLEILTTYYDNSFSFEIKAYDNYEAENLSIPPMIIQPIVENAILHGFNDIDYTGIINISFEKRTNSLLCIVDDNGIGFGSYTSKAKANSSTKVINERLAIIGKKYRQKAGITIVNRMQSEQNKGTIVYIEIPICNVKSV